MAPSRAILRCITSASVLPHIRPTLRPISTPANSRCMTTTSALHYSPVQHTGFPAICTRSYSQASAAAPEPPEYLNEAELHIFNKIKTELEPVKLEVQDVSGGCGSMYAIEIVSPKFAGLSPLKQTRLVNAVLKEELAVWHGIQLRTKAP
ncbi:bola protein [Paraphoma chrysanthemicola]|uniref:Bola protein n=1 Tax=Paraphoma chrysanthemicola TaxID=798071 RepID=A0A8K0VU12_9PLEO|nr:bola protein [Paraphoma chrysanthemicola]